MNKVYLSLGSNIGDKKKYIQIAIDLIEKNIGTIVSGSSVIETVPWGFVSENVFLNCVLEVKTKFSPLQVLRLTQEIEQQLGRMKKRKRTDEPYQDRAMDIDLILFNDLIIESEDLILPHPLFHQRKFVMEPLMEIAPDLIHPVLKKTIKDIYKNSTDF